MVRTDGKILKAGLVLATTVALGTVDMSAASRFGNATAAMGRGARATGNLVIYPFALTGRGVAWTGRNTLGRIPVPAAISTRWNGFTTWFGSYLHRPLNYGKRAQVPTTLMGKTRAKVAAALAPVGAGLSRAGNYVTNNRVAKTANEYLVQRPLDFVKSHQVAAKRTGIAVAAGAAVYGAYYLYNEMQAAERNIALADLEKRLASGDLQDATLATLVETRSIKEKELKAAEKRLARRQRAEGRSYVTREEQEGIERLNAELGEIDEALVVTYKADSSVWTRVANVVTHALNVE